MISLGDTAVIDIGSFASYIPCFFFDFRIPVVFNSTSNPSTSKSGFWMNLRDNLKLIAQLHLLQFRNLRMLYCTIKTLFLSTSPKVFPTALFKIVINSSFLNVCKLLST